jgi:PqqD family protein of HPr-rel-A system
MTGQLTCNLHYRAEPAELRIILPFDEMTLIYQRRSGITHIVADPVPQILQAMGDSVCDAGLISARLSAHYDLGEAAQARSVISARLEELAGLGLVEKLDRKDA